MSRIERDSTYYTDSKNRNCWCLKCHFKLPANEHIILDDGSEVKKCRLKCTKNDSTPEESFLECYDCKTRMHKICALHNCRIRKPDEVFRCHKCTNVFTEINGLSTSHPKAAKDLPNCSMSDFIQKGLLQSLEKRYRERAAQDGVDIDSVDKATDLQVRVMSHLALKQTVREEVCTCTTCDSCFWNSILFQTFLHLK